MISVGAVTAGFTVKLFDAWWSNDAQNAPDRTIPGGNPGTTDSQTDQLLSSPGSPSLSNASTSSTVFGNTTTTCRQHLLSSVESMHLLVVLFFVAETITVWDDDNHIVSITVQNLSPLLRRFLFCCIARTRIQDDDDNIQDDRSSWSDVDDDGSAPFQRMDAAHVNNIVIATP
jgi:hypothetical protein